MIHEWSDKREYVRMIYIYQLAKFNQAANPQVLMILREFIFDSMGILMAKEASTSVEKAGWISGGKAKVQGGAKGAAKARAQVANDAVQASAKNLSTGSGKAGMEYNLLMMHFKPARKPINRK